MTAGTRRSSPRHNAPTCPDNSLARPVIYPPAPPSSAPGRAPETRLSSCGTDAEIRQYPRFFFIASVLLHLGIFPKILRFHNEILQFRYFYNKKMPRFFLISTVFLTKIDHLLIFNAWNFKYLNFQKILSGNAAWCYFPSVIQSICGRKLLKLIIILIYIFNM